MNKFFRIISAQIAFFPIIFIHLFPPINSNTFFFITFLIIWSFIIGYVAGTFK